MISLRHAVMPLFFFAMRAARHAAYAMMLPRCRCYATRQRPRCRAIDAFFSPCYAMLRCIFFAAMLPRYATLIRCHGAAASYSVTIDAAADADDAAFTI